MSKNLTALSARQGLANNLFERLGELAEPTGSPEAADLRRLAEEFLMGPANLYGSAAFYDLTRPENRGKRIYVCNGTACRLAGTQSRLRTQLSHHFAENEIGELCCLGRCHENGAFQYEGRTYSGQVPENMEHLFRDGAVPKPDHYTVEAWGQPLLTGSFPGWDHCRPAITRMLTDGPEKMLSAIHTSGLRGRGGAGFPAGTKLEACRSAKGQVKYIVCNADEGDPGAYSDRYLLEQKPYAVLLGMLIAGYAAGAHTGVVYLRAEYPEAISIIQRAIAELQDRQLGNGPILGSDFAFHFKLIAAKGAYICGEETALLASIEGQRPEVRVRPPYPTDEGLFGKPTVVTNVETLANLFYILTNSGEAFAATGLPGNSGTKLLSLNSAFRRPGVYEVPMGTPLSVVLDQLGGGFRQPVKALHIGGPLGGLVPLALAGELAVDFDSFARHGFLLGHASIIGIPEDYPMIDYLAHLFAFTAHESCGKCVPCRLGSMRGKELLQRAIEQGSLINPGLFNDLLDTLERGSLCGLGGGLPLPVRNALTHFAEELAPYFQRI